MGGHGQDFCPVHSSQRSRSTAAARRRPSALSSRRSGAGPFKSQVKGGGGRRQGHSLNWVGLKRLPPPPPGPPHFSLPTPFPVSVYFPNYSGFSCFVPGTLGRNLGAGQLAGGTGEWGGVEEGEDGNWDEGKNLESSAGVCVLSGMKPPRGLWWRGDCCLRGMGKGWCVGVTREMCAKGKREGRDDG